MEFFSKAEAHLLFGLAIQQAPGIQLSLSHSSRPKGTRNSASPTGAEDSNLSTHACSTRTSTLEHFTPLWLAFFLFWMWSPNNHIYIILSIHNYFFSLYLFLSIERIHLIFSLKATWVVTKMYFKIVGEIPPVYLIMPLSMLVPHYLISTHLTLSSPAKSETFSLGIF